MSIILIAFLKSMREYRPVNTEKWWENKKCCNIVPNLL